MPPSLVIVDYNYPRVPLDVPWRAADKYWLGEFHRLRHFILNASKSRRIFQRAHCPCGPRLTLQRSKLLTNSLSRDVGHGPRQGDQPGKLVEDAKTEHDRQHTCRKGCGSKSEKIRSKQNRSQIQNHDRTFLMMHSD